MPNILLGSSSNSVKAYGLYIVLLSREMEGEIEKRIGLDSQLEGREGRREKSGSWIS